MFRTLGLALIFCSLAVSAVSDPVASAPATRAELARKIREYQNAQNCDGMIGLFYSEGTDKERYKAFTQTVKTYLCSNFGHGIASIAFQDVAPDQIKTPSDFNGTHSQYTLTPKGAVVIDYGHNTRPMETKSLSFLYGTHDNKTYLITTKKADAK